MLRSTRDAVEGLSRRFSAPEGVHTQAVTPPGTGVTVTPGVGVATLLKRRNWVCTYPVHPFQLTSHHTVPYASTVSCCRRGMRTSTLAPVLAL